MASDLIRQALKPRPSGGASGGVFPVFPVADDAPAITPDTVRDALEEP